MANNALINRATALWAANHCCKGSSGEPDHSWGISHVSIRLDSYYDGLFLPFFLRLHLPFFECVITPGPPKRWLSLRIVQTKELLGET